MVNLSALRRALSSIFLVVFGLLANSCSHSPEVRSVSNFVLHVNIEPLEGKDSWRATFESNVPVRELVFRRQSNRFRSKLWRAKTPGVTIVEENGEEKIKSPTDFTSVTFEFESYYEDTPKDYEFFQAFSDKSVVMYTGHLNACPPSVDCERAAEFTFLPRQKEKGIVAGQVFEKSYRWKDETGRGTYVYFGHLKPIQTPQLTALIDPKIPKWLRTRFNDLLPKLFAYYQKKTSHPLTFKPFVFLSYSPEGEGSGSKGGTLPGIVQLALDGKGWHDEDSESFIDLARFLAHESAHIWNGQLFRYESGEMWMHEGGADAFAFRALRDLKIVTDRRFAEFQTEAFNECLSRVKNRPLRKVTEDPNFTAFYRCGAIYALLTEAAIQQNNPKLDLFSFWHEVFGRAKSNGGFYTEGIYFEVLDRLANEKQTSSAVRNLLDGNPASTLETFLSEFKRLKVPYSKDANQFPRAYNLRIARGLLRELMKADCQGRVGLTQSSQGIATEGMSECSVFKKPRYVTHLAGLSIPSSGAKAYDQIRGGCTDPKFKVEIKSRNQTEKLFVKCPETIPDREPYVLILSAEEKK